MSLVNQLRHDLTFKARLSLPEVDELLAVPELAADGQTPTAAQTTLRDILRQSPEAPVLQLAIGTFQRDLIGRPAVAEAATDEAAAETLVSELDAPVVVTERTLNEADLAGSLVDLPSGSGD
jgi:hypothetical protein